MLFARDFRVESLLSAGGMGAVYRAMQESTGRTRALKIMLPELLADPKARDRFAQEARVGGRIESANVVEVIAAGVDEATGTPWLAMEHLDGQDLAQRLASQGRLEPAMASEVLLQVCDALGAAHRVGVVHCDLKPENVFLSKPRTRGSNVLVKVLDFGIARLVQENRSSVQVTTAMGSPLFMAPEQGKRGQSVKPATDVWALGLLSFHALTGRHYWRSANVAAEDFDLMQQIVEVATGELTPPSVRLRELGVAEAQLPAGFDAWFAGCVARDIVRRFPSAVEAGDALERVFGAAPSASPVASSPPQISTQIALPSMPMPGVARAPTPAPTPAAASPSASPVLSASPPISTQIALLSMPLPGVAPAPTPVAASDRPTERVPALNSWWRRAPIALAGLTALDSVLWGRLRPAALTDSRLRAWAWGAIVSWPVGPEVLRATIPVPWWCPIPGSLAAITLASIVAYYSLVAARLGAPDRTLARRVTLVLASWALVGGALRFLVYFLRMKYRHVAWPHVLDVLATPLRVASPASLGIAVATLLAARMMTVQRSGASS